jgi:hypothetical protein
MSGSSRKWETKSLDRRTRRMDFASSEKEKIGRLQFPTPSGPDEGTAANGAVQVEANGIITGLLPTSQFRLSIPVPTSPVD